MSLRLSYRKEDGETLLCEMGLSESYEDVITALCTAWKNEIPPNDHITDRYLVRDEVSDDTTKVVRILPCRFVGLVREMPPGRDLELRLELRTRTGGRGELPPAMNSSTDTNNSGGSSSEQLHVQTITPRNNPPGAREPLTPRSMLGIGHHDAGASPTISQNNSATQDPAPDPALDARQISIPDDRRGNISDNVRNAAYDNGMNAYSNGLYENARIHFQDAIGSFQERGDSRREAECLTHLGVISRHERKYSDARSYFIDARTIYEGLGYREKQLYCNRQLVEVDEKAGDFSKALQGYEDIKNIARNERLLKEEAWSTFCLGRVHNEIRLYDEAFRRLNEALALAQSIPSLNTRLELEAFAAEQCGRSKMLQGDKDQAIEYYERALRQFVAGGRGRWVADEKRVEDKLKELQRSSPIFGRIFRRQSIIRGNQGH